jgi:rSAM/selenodomain-associated transferase 2
MNSTATPLVSVIVPVLHEAGSINALLDHVKAQARPGPVEIVVADGAGDTLAALNARHADAVRIKSAPGRARQMNAAADAARGEVLLFLHADTRLPPGGLVAAVQALERWGSSAGAGAFGLAFDGGGRRMALVARLGAWRNRLCRTPYGDQALFLRAAAFRELGGFADIPLMEDVELCRRLRRQGRPARVLDLRARTSARRYGTRPLRTGLRNNVLRLLFALGADPARLARWYRAAGPGND